MLRVCVCRLEIVRVSLYLSLVSLCSTSRDGRAVVSVDVRVGVTVVGESPGARLVCVGGAVGLCLSGGVSK